jgi:hypothetical protein
MTPSIASEDPWPIAAAETAAALDPGIAAPAKRGAPQMPVRTFLGLLDDAALLLLIALLFPVLILLIGMPVALLVRLMMAIAHRS